MNDSINSKPLDLLGINDVKARKKFMKEHDIAPIFLQDGIASPEFATESELILYCTILNNLLNKKFNNDTITLEFE